MNIIEVKGCTHRYASGYVALDDVNLSIEEGAFFGLLGPNGAGKTTLIHALSSLLRPTAGEILVKGRSIEQDRSFIKRKLGLVPQELNMNMHLPVWHVLLNQAGYFGVPRSKAKGLAEKWLKALGLMPHRHKLIRQLSGGMKRRVMIARALMHEPSLLLLDEPTAGVDVELKHLTWDLLQQLNRDGVSVLLTTHNLEEAEHLCQDLAIINQGKLLTRGTKAAIMAHLSGERFHVLLDKPVEGEICVPNFQVRALSMESFEVVCGPDQSLHDLFDALGVLGLRVNRVWKPSSRLEEVFLHVLKEGV